MSIFSELLPNYLSRDQSYGISILIDRRFLLWA